MHKLRFLFLVLVFCSVGLPGCAKQFSDDFSQKPDLNLYSFYSGLTFENCAHRCIDAKSLSTNAVLKFAVHLTKVVDIKLVSSNSSNQKDLFYCEQAIWDSLALWRESEDKSVSYETRLDKNAFSLAPISPNCDELYFQAHPEQKKEAYVIHVIPISAQYSCQHAINQREIHSLANLRAIPISKAHSPLLNSYRQEWLTYFQQRPARLEMSRKELFENANRIFEKYKSLFISNEKNG